jgi:hypothetical protein
MSYVGPGSRIFVQIVDFNDDVLICGVNKVDGVYQL